MSGIVHCLKSFVLVITLNIDCNLTFKPPHTHTMKTLLYVCVCVCVCVCVFTVLPQVILLVWLSSRLTITWNHWIFQSGSHLLTRLELHLYTKLTISFCCCLHWLYNIIQAAINIMKHYTATTTTTEPIVGISNKKTLQILHNYTCLNNNKIYLWKKKEKRKLSVKVK